MVLVTDIDKVVMVVVADAATNNKDKDFTELPANAAEPNSCFRFGSLINISSAFFLVSRRP